METRIRVGGIDLTELRYPGGYRLPRHVHARPMFCYALRGGYREHVGGRALDAGPGSVVFLPGGEPHRDRVAPEGLAGLRVEVADDRVGNVPGLGGTGPSLLTGPVEHWARALVDELERPGPPLRISVESLATLVLAEVSRYTPGPERRRPAWLRRLRDRIHAEFADLPGLAELARDADRHPSHVARAFRRHMGCTIGEYARRRRLAAARELVEGTDRPLAAVALECGYADQSHLGRAFKARFGVSPGRYRTLARSR